MSAFASSGNNAANAYRRFVPIPDLSRCSTGCLESRLLDHLVGAAEQRDRKGEAERPGRLEIDPKSDLGLLLNRQVARFGPLEDFPRIYADLPIRFGKTGVVAHQTAPRH